MGFLDKLLKGAKIVGDMASEVSNAQKPDSFDPALGGLCSL